VWAGQIELSPRSERCPALNDGIKDGLHTAHRRELPGIDGLAVEDNFQVFICAHELLDGDARIGVLKAILRIVKRQWRCFPVARMCPVKHPEKLLVIVGKFHDSYDGCDVLT
jgi:hypothetical protein